MKCTEFRFESYKMNEKGKMVSTSKRSHLWNFSVDSSPFELLATESHISHSFRIYLNKEVLFELKVLQKELLNGINISTRKFGLRICKISEFFFDLFVDNHLFIPNTTKKVSSDISEKSKPDTEAPRCGGKLLSIDHMKRSLAGDKSLLSKQKKFLEYEENSASKPASKKKNNKSPASNKKQVPNISFTQKLQEIFQKKKSKGHSRATSESFSSKSQNKNKKMEMTNPQLRYLDYKQNIADNIPKPSYFDFYFQRLKLNKNENREELIEGSKETLENKPEKNSFSLEQALSSLNCEAQSMYRGIRQKEKEKEASKIISYYEGEDASYCNDTRRESFLVDDFSSKFTKNSETILADDSKKRSFGRDKNLKKAMSNLFGDENDV